MQLMKRMALSAVIATVMAGQVQAGMITLDATDSGSYSRSGFHDDTSIHYFVAAARSDSSPARNFFTFDLGSVSGTIVGATLRLENPSSGFEVFPATYSLFDLSAPIPELTMSHSRDSSAGQAIHTDLGTGKSYGSIGVDYTSKGTILAISLNAQAISDLNAAVGGDFAIGGALSGSTFVTLFSGTASPLLVRQLVLETSSTVTTTTPEPSSLALLSIGAAMTGLGAARLRRREQLQPSEDSPQEA
ncbi:hypothetical protein Mal4_58510 [Maioricimonas rarisocia]|uniref:PEP-CTERM protein-sorting domain-containing protein n=1 Tax=Maioricimonas rarisocia TaxID=2528026 RepID=A0A517ZG71_9PLAN|nr:PEP-CTERM sorting domain-containing protein [Maioricimonas rarisocia]QDU41483.1 hypothetical protein Mal4_58510 [Maioricimonas rarisocia]